jgi:hypothetical protein
MPQVRQRHIDVLKIAPRSAITVHVGQRRHAPLLARGGLARVTAVTARRRLRGIVTQSFALLALDRTAAGASPAAAAFLVAARCAGDNSPLGRLLLNRVAHRRAFPPTRIRPWTRHHIEEIGNLENFLPDLFRDRADQEP